MTKANPIKDYRIPLFIMMLLEIAIWGAWQPKIFAYMGMLEFSSWQQSLVGAVFGIASILGIFFSNQFADRNFSAERFLAFSHAVGGTALIAASYVTEFWSFFALFLIYGLLYVPTISVTNSLAFAHLKNPAKDFGLVRMGGTVGWIVVSWPFIFLLSAEAGPDQVRWIFIVGGIISYLLAIFSLFLPHTPPRKDVEGLDRLAWIKAGKLLGVPFVLTLFIVTFIDSVIHNGYFVVSDIFLTSRVGISANLSMVVMSIGQVAEILTMIVLGLVLARLGWKWTMIVGILGHGLRFATFAFLPDLTWMIIGVQILHGICYAFFFCRRVYFRECGLSPRRPRQRPRIVQFAHSGPGYGRSQLYLSPIDGAPETPGRFGGLADLVSCPDRSGLPGHYPHGRFLQASHRASGRKLKDINHRGPRKNCRRGFIPRLLGGRLENRGIKPLLR